MNNLGDFSLNNIITLQQIISKTIISCQKYKSLNIYGSNELNICISTLEEKFNILNFLQINIVSHSELSKTIMQIKNDLILILKNFGTESIKDIIYLAFDNFYIKDNFTNNSLSNKFELLDTYTHPISFKVIEWKNNNQINNKKIIKKNRIIDEPSIIENSENLECFDLSRTNKDFYIRVYGINICLHDYKNRKTYVVACITDDIIFTCINSIFLSNKINNLNKIISKDTNNSNNSNNNSNNSNNSNNNSNNNEYWNNFFNSLSLNKILIYSESELHENYQSILIQLDLIKQKTITQVVKEFISNELYGQRNIIIQLLIKSNEKDFQYLSYLLYDLLSSENNNKIDTTEQTLLYNSLPWNCKKLFQSAMKQTINYTNKLNDFDNNKIPLEQQICLMKTSDSIKEKAILKLKEIKAKSEDSGSKAKQYLEGLLKIPFGVIKEENILTIIDETHKLFNTIINNINKQNVFSYDLQILQKEKYINIEILDNIKIIEETYIKQLEQFHYDELIKNIKLFKKEHLVNMHIYINQLIKTNNIEYKKLNYSGKKMILLQENVIEFIKNVAIKNNMIDNIYEKFSKIILTKNFNPHILEIKKNISTIKNNISDVSFYMEDVTRELDKSVHGHEKAKRQISRIIGQWINGEKSGYCFGFEGPPGIGKTSLAKKGIANCLKDEYGKSRPFSFIAVGGSANGSTLEGHNYTYVGSTWGRIVDILIDSKCMNPIIFIDELDKISKTEHGRELIGILTHLIDPTQNDSFQDKYFSGINLDLSKALFIFSYNDVELIDRILLDRIHRIKFNHLSLDEKIVICRNYILPEIYKKMGFENIININDDVIQYIIKTYTNESGVRKLKEILFDIFGEINLELLTNMEHVTKLPVNITIDNIKTNYLKNRPQHTIKKICDTDSVGVVSGLWANGLGQGGLLPIEARLLPSSTFLDLKLTGMQGDVMKESMNVARTLAWELLDNDIKSKLQKSFEKTKSQGIHIHVPEGATPKDGPSGGAAITTVIYSLLSNKVINKSFAMTGEICLQGKVTAIGGLNLKILGGIEAGATNFIYPKDNQKDYDEFYEKLDNKEILEGISFYPVDNIHDVFKIIFID